MQKEVVAWRTRGGARHDGYAREEGHFLVNDAESPQAVVYEVFVQVPG